MADEILRQKIRFAKQIIVMLRWSAIVLAVVTVAGAAFALNWGKLSAVFMGLLAGGAATAFMLLHYRHVRAWLKRNELQP